MPRDRQVTRRRHLPVLHRTRNGLGHRLAQAALGHKRPAPQWAPVGIILGLRGLLRHLLQTNNPNIGSRIVSPESSQLQIPTRGEAEEASIERDGAVWLAPIKLRIPHGAI